MTEATRVEDLIGSMGALTLDDLSFEMLKQAYAPLEGYIPKGTVLYGAYPSTDSSICDDLTPRYDKDTGKRGKYFSDGMLIPLGMILEYGDRADGKKMYLCTYELLDDVAVYVGKYASKTLEMERYYDTPYDYLDSLKVGPRKAAIPPAHSYNHYEVGLTPIHDFFWDDSRGEVEEAEVFIGAHDLHKVRAVRADERRAYTAEEAYEILDALVPRVF